MCLLVIAWQLHPAQDLIVAANRDERHERATAPLDLWPDLPGVAAGRDLVAGGSWLGVDARGRFACVTNYRGEPTQSGSSHSRGRLVSGFLGGERSAADYLAGLASDAGRYPDFNLLIADGEALWYASNRAPGFSRRLGPGVHGLSNDLLDVAWPKVERCKQGLRAELDAGGTTPTALFDLLAERQPGQMPAATGLPWPASSGPFIAHEHYGTRCSTVVLRQPGSTWVGERRFGPNGRPEGSSALRIHRQD
jgi:uncharacterized protein with NRDE domain